MAGPLSHDQARDVGRLLAVIRTGIGVTTLLAPSLARLWVGAPGATAGGRTLSRSLAVREIVLGWGTLIAGSDPARLRVWLAAGAFGDCIDAVGHGWYYRPAEIVPPVGHGELERSCGGRSAGGAVAIRPGRGPGCELKDRPRRRLSGPGTGARERRRCDERRQRRRGTSIRPRRPFSLPGRLPGGQDFLPQCFQSGVVNAGESRERLNGVPQDLERHPGANGECCLLQPLSCIGPRA